MKLRQRWVYDCVYRLDITRANSECSNNEFHVLSNLEKYSLKMSVVTRL